MILPMFRLAGKTRFGHEKMRELGTVDYDLNWAMLNCVVCWSKGWTLGKAPWKR